MNLHRNLVENQDSVEETFFTWLWSKLEEKLEKNPEATPFVTGDEILVAAKYELLSRKLQKKLTSAWGKFIDNDVLYHDRDLQENFHWFGKKRLKKWRLVPFDKIVLKQY
ncbi:MAG TPA: hypothetical protein DCS83_07815 [Prevotella sp.]|nr:hypothetical protein [Prevotella sp.]